MAETAAERVKRIQGMDPQEASKQAIAVASAAMDALDARQTPSEWGEDDGTRCTVTMSLGEWTWVVGTLFEATATDGLQGQANRALFDAEIGQQIVNAMLAAQAVAAIPAKTALSA